MQLPSALVWSLLLAGADAKLRALRRDSGVCSMEIVATVTRTYTIPPARRLSCHARLVQTVQDQFILSTVLLLQQLLLLHRNRRSLLQTLVKGTERRTSIPSCLSIL